MPEKLLQIGDIIELKENMSVFTDIPKKFHYGDDHFSTDLCHVAVCIGSVLCNAKESKYHLIDQILPAIRNLNIPVSWEQAEAFIDSLNLNLEAESFNTAYLAGKYIVNTTSSDNFSTFTEESGYHVFCHKVDDPKIQVDFYQTVSRMGLIPNIVPISSNNA